MRAGAALDVETVAAETALVRARTPGAAEGGTVLCEVGCERAAAGRVCAVVAIAGREVAPRLSSRVRLAELIVVARTGGALGDKDDMEALEDVLAVERRGVRVGRD